MIEKFSNDKISLTRLQKNDARAIFQALKNSVKEISPWLGWLTPDYGLKNAEDFISLQIENWQNSIEFSYAIRDLQGHFLGVISLHLFDTANDVASIGYWMDSRYTSQGYCTQAVKLLVKSTIKLLNLIRIEIIVAQENSASQKVAKKAGAHFEAVLKNRIRLNGLPVDAKIYCFTNP